MVWYKTWDAVTKLEVGGYRGTSAATVKFVDEWENKRCSQSKLSFYNSIKAHFGYESYLNIKDSTSRKHLTRLRISAHDLNIELGRYSSKGKTSSVISKVCRVCCSKEEISQLELLEGLPYFNPILETEQHVITECPGYHHLRINLSEHLKCQLLLCDYTYVLNHPILAEELGSFLSRSFLLRNPKRRKASSASPTA